MIKGLYRRLSLVLLTVFLILGAVLFWVYDNATQELQQKTAQRLHLKLATYLVMISSYTLATNSTVKTSRKLLTQSCT